MQHSRKGDAGRGVQLQSLAIVLYCLLCLEGLQRAASRRESPQWDPRPSILMMIENMRCYEERQCVVPDTACLSLLLIVQVSSALDITLTRMQGWQTHTIRSPRPHR